MSCYEHTDVKSTLIGAITKKIPLPKDLLYKSEPRALLILSIQKGVQNISEKYLSCIKSKFTFEFKRQKQN